MTTFSHCQLFERLSDLISISFTGGVDLLEEGGGISLFNPAAHKELKDQGTFQVARLVDITYIITRILS